MKLTTHQHLLPKLRLSRAICLLPYTLVRAGTNLLFFFFFFFKLFKGEKEVHNILLAQNLTQALPRIQQYLLSAILFLESD